LGLLKSFNMNDWRNDDIVILHYGCWQLQINML
jgi:hypothetical protein